MAAFHPFTWNACALLLKSSGHQKEVKQNGFFRFLYMQRLSVSCYDDHCIHWSRQFVSSKYIFSSEIGFHQMLKMILFLLLFQDIELVTLYYCYCYYYYLLLST